MDEINKFLTYIEKWGRESERKGIGLDRGYLESYWRKTFRRGERDAGDRLIKFQKPVEVSVVRV